jgi:hypothetical protein
MGVPWRNAIWPLNPDTMLLLTDGCALVHDVLRPTMQAGSCGKPVRLWQISKKA